MAEYIEALKRPFTDIKKLVLGIVISIIPIVNFLFMGYLLKVAKSSMNKKRELPEWEELPDLFMKGILAMVIGIIYMIPVGIVALIGVFTGLLALPSLADIAPLALITWLFGAGIVAIIVLIVAIIFALLCSVALLGFADTEKFGAAFEFSDVMRKAFTGQYIGGWLLTMIVGAVIAFVFGLIPVIGALLVPYIVGVFAYTILGQIYGEL